MKFAHFATGGLAAALAIGAFAATPAAAQTYLADPPGTVYEEAPIYGPAPVYEPGYEPGGYVVAPHRRVIVDEPVEPVVMTRRQHVYVPQPEPAPYSSAIRVRSNFDDARVDPSSVRIGPDGRMCRTVEVESTAGILRQHTYCD